MHPIIMQLKALAFPFVVILFALIIPIIAVLHFTGTLRTVRELIERLYWRWRFKRRLRTIWR